MSSKGGSPYNPQTTPKYLQDFSKALAGEVRILLAEVGKLRDERSQLQNEIAELMALKSKHGGALPPWQGQGMGMAIEGPPPMMGMPEDALALVPPPPEEQIQARPGWRTVHKKAERRPRKAIAAPPPPTAPTPPPHMHGHYGHEPPQSAMPSWAQWRPNPLLAPTPLVAPSRMAATPPPRPGLFGATTPPPGGR
ncbi:hypothetical protein DFP72DRAFT_208437 [Ephemerocybe angulata]|uniref:Uncharacterized protein n=1 Tax=Ephemerocybe angulata TaxID=980116 RepID=A0A8H6MBB2_9AGAR|nr:hypothetical protein DFP72DRAFT_208437 [Tulosesus angulatus]